MLLMLLLAVTVTSTPIPFDVAQRVFEDAKHASDEDGGRLWGRTLYGPILLVDSQSRFAVANVADADGALTPVAGLFTGTIDGSVILANTATNWHGTRWTMVSSNLLSFRAVPRRQLLMHECWHRIQNEIGFPATDAVNPHLDSLEGRYWLILELRALAAALRSDGAARTNAIGDAAAFRAKRRAIFEGAANQERALENNEGLAEYTGWGLRGTTDRESRLVLANALTSFDPNASFARSFAYLTGPAYGLLLDTLSPGWTRQYEATRDLAQSLAGAKASGSAEVAPEAAKRYGGAELLSAEVGRNEEVKQRVARYRALLVDGPVLELPMTDAHYGFDPMSVTALPDIGSVYPTLEVTAAWGTLSAKTGALIASDFSRIVVPAAIKDSPALRLNTGWKLVPGTRQGDYRVTR